jgi:hypothetical protein
MVGHRAPESLTVKTEKPRPVRGLSGAKLVLLALCAPSGRWYSGRMLGGCQIREPQRGARMRVRRITRTEISKWPADYGTELSAVASTKPPPFVVDLASGPSSRVLSSLTKRLCSVASSAFTRPASSLSSFCNRATSARGILPRAVTIAPMVTMAAQERTKITK